MLICKSVIAQKSHGIQLQEPDILYFSHIYPIPYETLLQGRIYSFNKEKT